MSILRLILLLFLLSGLAAAQEDEETEAEAVSYPRIEHSGQLQIQLNDGALGSDSRNSFTPENNGLAPFPASDRLFIRRFRPAWVVQFSPNLELDTEFELDTDEGRIETLDLFLNYKVSDHTELRLGRYKVPFGWEGLRSSRTTNTIERSDATVYMYPERDVGLTVHHEQDGIGEFSLGTFLGQPRSNGDANGGVDLIGRAVFPLSEGLRVGASGHVGSFRPTGTRLDIPVRRVGGELQWETGPFRFETEAIYSDGYNTASDADTEAFGYYLSTVYTVADPLDLVLSYDRFDPDLNAVDANFAENAVNSRDRKVIGLNYYISREPIHRIMLNYEIRHSLEGAPLDTSGFRLRYQLSW